MGIISWEDPSLRRGGRASEFYSIVEELKKNPGQWAVVAEDKPTSTQTYLRKRYGLEVTCRGIKGSRAAKIYARWVAPAD